MGNGDREGKYAIDPSKELLVAVDDIPLCVQQRTQWRPSRSCVRRWMDEGIGGQRLPSVRWAGRRFVSQEAIIWWLERINQGDGEPDGGPAGGLVESDDQRGTGA